MAQRYLADGNSIGINMKIHDIPKELRPREKALLNGISSLSETELLALVLGSGSRGHNVLEVAQNLLEQNGGLTQLSGKSFAVLTMENGISEARAFSLLAVFEIAKRIAALKPFDDVIEPEDLFERYKAKLCILEEEQMILLIFNRSKKLIREVMISKGKESSNIPSENQIINELIGVKGSKFVLLHNHPSGICLPSPDDMSFNMKIIERTKGTKYVLLDHLILTNNGYYSFKENGLLF